MHWLTIFGHRPLPVESVFAARHRVIDKCGDRSRIRRSVMILELATSTK
jgi:hypothetical protein